MLEYVLPISPMCQNLRVFEDLFIYLLLAKKGAFKDWFLRIKGQFVTQFKAIELEKSHSKHVQNVVV